MKHPDLPAWLRAAGPPGIPATGSDGSETSWMKTVFGHSVISGGGVLHSASSTGHAKAGIAALASRIADLGGILIHERTTLEHTTADDADDYDVDDTGAAMPVPEVSRAGQLEYAWPDTFAILEHSDRSATLHAWSASKERLAQLTEIARTSLERRPVGSLYAMVERHGGLMTQRLTSVTTPLCRDNYTAGVLGAFDHVVADMAARSPCGRLVLVDGPPGAGKTHLVRGLIEAVPGAMFVVAPSASAEKLSGPDILPVLMSAGRSHGTEPLVLVVEDADNCLVPRAADNVNAISTILNISDGLIGGAMNLWVVATTNARHKDVDAAIVRPGRLCRRVAVDALTPEHAARVHRRIVGTDRIFPNPATLAEVYAAARSDAAPPDRQPSDDRSPRVGFGR